MGYAMSEYRYTASEVDAIIARYRDHDSGLAVISMGLAALSGFIVACAIWGVAWAAGWLS